MERAERQRLTLERIDPVLKAKGYKTRKADGMWYYLHQDGITVTWSLSFLKKYSFIDFRGASITHDEVEKTYCSGLQMRTTLSDGIYIEGQY